MSSPVFDNLHEPLIINTGLTDHCLKSKRIRSFPGLYFPAFGLNNERYGIIRTNAGKYGPEKLRIWTLFMQRTFVSFHHFDNHPFL